MSKFEIQIKKHILKGQQSEQLNETVKLTTTTTEIEFFFTLTYHMEEQDMNSQLGQINWSR